MIRQGTVWFRSACRVVSPWANYRPHSPTTISSEECGRLREASRDEARFSTGFTSWRMIGGSPSVGFDALGHRDKDVRPLAVTVQSLADDVRVKERRRERVTGQNDVIGRCPDLRVDVGSDRRTEPGR